MQIIEQSVKLITPSSPGAQLSMVKSIEYAARNCYDSSLAITEDSYKTLIASLIKRGHLTPLEFGQITLEMITSRDVMAEWTRHRHMASCIRSQRYVTESKDGDISFIKPVFADDVKNGYLNFLWQKACAESERNYKELLSEGAQKQDARKVLNNSVATKIISTMNVRELRHILSLRMSPQAYPEMQVLAKGIYLAVKQIPCVFGGLECYE